MINGGSITTLQLLISCCVICIFGLKFMKKAKHPMYSLLLFILGIALLTVK